MRSVLACGLPLLLGLASACAPAEVVVSIEIEVDDPAGSGRIPRALSEVEVRLLPFDRDAVFDSIVAVYPTPEPEIPAELLAAREDVQATRAALDQAQRRWNILRDTLQKLNAVMQPLERSGTAYILLFRDFTDIEGQLPAVEREVNAAFIRFDSLQQGTIRASDSVRILREHWGDEAFADVADIFEAKAASSGLDVAVDTTDATGVARGGLLVRPGRYWVHARYELPYTELYWNVPIDVVRGAQLQVRLDRSNAEERLRL
jgi:hypothetical protein